MITLDDGDKMLMRQCPFTLLIPKHPTREVSARLKRIDKLWRNKLIRGETVDKGTLKVAITEAGRVALYGNAAAPASAATSLQDCI